MPTNDTINRAFALAIETSGQRAGVALGIGRTVLAAQPLDSHRRHAADLLPAIDALCLEHAAAPKAIRTVYVSAGPGSFTGLRVGITVARMIAFANRAAIVPVPTLQAIALNALGAVNDDVEVVVMLDAKRSHAYASRFRLIAGSAEPIDAPAEVLPAAYLAQCAANCVVIGEGVPAHRAAIQASERRILGPEFDSARAENVFTLGATLAAADAFVDPRFLVPTYIRPPEPEEKLARRP